MTIKACLRLPECSPPGEMLTFVFNPGKFTVRPYPNPHTLLLQNVPSPCYPVYACCGPYSFLSRATSCLWRKEWDLAKYAQDEEDMAGMLSEDGMTWGKGGMQTYVNIGPGGLHSGGSGFKGQFVPRSSWHLKLKSRQTEKLWGLSCCLACLFLFFFFFISLMSWSLSGMQSYIACTSICNGAFQSSQIVIIHGSPKPPGS